MCSLNNYPVRFGGSRPALPCNADLCLHQYLMLETATGFSISAARLKARLLWGWLLPVAHSPCRDPGHTDLRGQAVGQRDRTCRSDH